MFGFLSKFFKRPVIVKVLKEPVSKDYAQTIKSLHMDRIEKALSKSRSYYKTSTQTLGSHQLAGHFDACLTLSLPPEPWELYESARVFNLPRTGFYNDHRFEITAALQGAATIELLLQHAVASEQFLQSLTAEEIHKHGHLRSIDGTISFYDSDTKSWENYSGKTAIWSDARDTFQKIVAETPDEFMDKVKKNLARMEARKNPTARQKEELKSYKSHFNSLKNEDAILDREKYRKDLNLYLAKLETMQNFPDVLFTLLRGAENKVREEMGIPLVGEGWVSETELFYRIKLLFPDQEVIQHGQVRWLGKQHFDVWLPELLVAVEYQGVQHFSPLDHFGGLEGFEKTRKRDEKKRNLCLENGVRLIEIRYDEPINDDELHRLLCGLNDAEVQRE